MGHKQKDAATKVAPIQLYKEEFARDMVHKEKDAAMQGALN